MTYEQDYSFLPTYHHDEVPRKMGNDKMKVAGYLKLPALIFYGQIKLAVALVWHSTVKIILGVQLNLKPM